MSLVTQCPQCALLFQVPADQLAQAQGQVRCGQCAHVFEGEAFALHAPDVPLQADAFLAAPRVDVEALLRRKDVTSEPLPPSAAPVASRDFLAPMSKASPPPLRADAEASLLLKSHLRSEPRPVSEAPADRWWHRSLALVLVVGLCLQALVFFRDELVARFPASQPILSALCMPANCVLQPLRRWNGIVIEGSSLVRGDAGYILNVTLRNSVEVPLAMTAMEMTLTDDQDRALSRRVLSPSDLGAPSVLAPGQVWQRALKVEFNSTEADIAGYRLVSFYP
jgi:predicted Zn finger-like uncharacterized protein